MDIKALPQQTGIYILKNKGGEIIYIGKTTNIRERVKTHLKNKTWHAAPTLPNPLASESASVDYILTVNEPEALIKESELIKKYQPRYNIMLRDDKQYFYVCFSRDKLPQLTVTHQPSTNLLLRSPSLKVREGAGGVSYSSRRYPTKSSVVGPFTDGKSLKTVLRYLRKIFPYYTAAHRKLPCSYCHIGLCPGPNPNIQEYKKNTVKIKAILNGKRPRVLSVLKKEMAQLSKEQNFEKAAKVRDQVRALENVFIHRTSSPSLLFSGGFEGHFCMVPRRGQNDPNLGASRWAGENDARKHTARGLISNRIKSLEAYDISNIQGREPVASMVRFDNGKPNKSMYRKFRIRLPEKPNDVAMIHEVIKRRLRHTEWPYPDLFLIDGGKAQLNAALAEIPDTKYQIPDVAALAKRFNELYIPRRKNPIPLDTLHQEVKHLLMHARDEAHRFAISYHRKLHRKKAISH